MKEWIVEECPALTIDGKILSTMLRREQELVRCKNCVKRGFDDCPVNGWMPNKSIDDWFCADGQRET